MTLLRPVGGPDESWLVLILKKFNALLHVLLAVALVVASIMVVLEFSMQVLDSFKSGELAQGFLHALGTLFIVWTLSSLIAAEIEYVQTNRFHLRVFIEVAMITLLRTLIVDPIQAVTTNGGDRPFDVVHYGALLVAILIVGIVHRLIGDGKERERAAAAARGGAD